MSVVTLYGLERSVYTRIARLALEEKHISYDLREVEIFGPEGVPREHFHRHPFGRIPVLQHADFVVYETAAITRYVNEAFPGPVLEPDSAAARGRMNQITGLLDSYAYRPMVWGVFAQRISVPLEGGAPNESEISGALGPAATCLNALERLADPDPFLLGGDLTLADLHAFPILRYFALAPEGHEMIAGHPPLHTWLEMMSGRPSVVRTRSSYDAGDVISPSTRGSPHDGR